MTENALPYHEPGVITILVQSSFLLILNLTGYALDKLIYCGLVGQIFIGVVWGTPGAAWLSATFEETVVQLGYLGLILIVFEGGLSTSTHALRSNLGLSIVVAVTGIGLPMTMSFSLLGLSHATTLQAFAAGSALCSTSLGTTFTVLKTSGLASSRLGIVLTSAAMFDDVVGLVMVQIISNLGPSRSSFTAITIVRPVAVSVAFFILVPLLCKFFIKPVSALLRQNSGKGPASLLVRIIVRKDVVFLLHSALLLAFVAGASYAGTSNLFASYLAGAVISWYDAIEVISAPENAPQKAVAKAESPVLGKPIQTADAQNCPSSSNQESQQIATAETALQTERTEDEFGNEPQLLEGSIGARPPGKSILGKHQDRSHQAMPLSRRLEPPKHSPTPVRILSNQRHYTGKEIYEQTYAAPVNFILIPFFFASIGFSIPISQMFLRSVIWRGLVYALLMALGKLFCGLWLVQLSKKLRSTNPAEKKHRWKPISLSKPKSLYPASLLGFAMIARGEIGFLVSAIAESNSIFSTGDDQATPEIFLVVTWAILLCTIMGPVAVGLLTRRVKRLQSIETHKKAGVEDPLGIWGIISETDVT